MRTKYDEDEFDTTENLAVQLTGHLARAHDEILALSDMDDIIYTAEQLVIVLSAIIADMEHEQGIKYE